MNAVTSVWFYSGKVCAFYEKSMGEQKDIYIHQEINLTILQIFNRKNNHVFLKLN